MRLHRRIAAATVTATMAMAVPAGPVALAETRTDGAAVEVEGVLERLADTVGGVDAAVRLPDGERMPVSEAGAARPGDRVSVTVPVPGAVEKVARSGGTIEGTDGRVDLDRRELRRAEDVPAPAGSDLSKATQKTVVKAGSTAPVEKVEVLSHAQSTGSVSGAHQVTVAIVVPKGVKGRAATTAQVAAQVANADAYWRGQSGGSISLRLAHTSRPYASAFSCKDNPFRMWTEAARATGFTEGPNKHLVMVFPREATKYGCSYGLASMGQKISDGGIAYVSDTAWPVFAHEVGHNFGLNHAKRLRCASVTDADLARVPSACSVAEYGDPFDIMAASARDSAGSLSVPQAARIGLLGSSGYVDVGSGTRTVTLNAVSSLTGVRGVRVRDPRSGAVYWVEFRTRTGTDAKLYMPMTAGVRVLREETATDENPWPGTVALDASPTGKDSDANWIVPSSHLFTSYGAGVSVAVKSVGRSTATVTVTASGSGARLAGGKAGSVQRIGRAASVPATPKVAISNKGVVSWRSTTKGARYDVVIRRVSGRSHGRPQTWYAGTTRTSATLKAARGTTLQVRARARTAGATGSWSGWRTVAFR